MKLIRILLAFFTLLTILSCNRTSAPDQLKGYRIIQNSRSIQDTAYYSIDLEFPYFVASTDEDGKLDILNQTIEALMDTAALYYWGLEPDSVKVLIEEFGSAGKYALSNTYQILDTTPDRISILMKTYSYALGAHGFTALHSYNFNLKKNEFLSIDDLLDLSTPENISQLNDLLIRFFENPEDCFTQSPTADSSFELFGMEDENLIFYYEAYALGAYFCGMASVKVPIKELKKAGLWKWGI